MPKRPFRAQMLQQRRSLSPEAGVRLSRAIQQQLLALPEYRDCELLALYSPVRNEVQTDLVAAHARQSGKRLAYPRVEGDGMVFHEVVADEALHCGAFGVCEPVQTRPVAATEIGLAIVPGVAFDRNGFRLGYGKGYYDRFWGHGERHAFLVGFAYGFQLVPQLPSEAHDLRLDLLLTEEGPLRFY